MTAAELIAFLIRLGITLSEQDQQKIRDGVVSDKAAADQLTDRWREQDAPRD